MARRISSAEPSYFPPSDSDYLPSGAMARSAKPAARPSGRTNQNDPIERIMAALRAGQTLSPSDVEVLSLHSTRWKDSASRIKSLEQNNQDLARTVNSLKAQLAELSRTVEVLNTQIANHLMGTPVPQTGKHLEDKDATITRLRHSDRAKGRVTSKWLSVKAAFGSAKQEAKGQATPTRPPMRDAATQTWPWHPIGQVAATQTDLPVPIIAGPTSGGASHASVTGPLRVLEVSMPPDDYD